MKDFLSKKTTIWGMTILGLILITAAFVQVARANPIHITADFYGTEPPPPDKKFPCNLDYFENAVLAWNPNSLPPYFNDGTLNSYPATLGINPRGIKTVPSTKELMLIPK